MRSLKDYSTEITVEGKTTSPWTNEELTTFELESNEVVQRKIAVWNGNS